jgi:hypothetical protein
MEDKMIHFLWNHSWHIWMVVWQLSVLTIFRGILTVLRQRLPLFSR